MDPNDRNEVTLDELARRYLGEALVKEIDNSNLRVRVRLPAGDELSVTVTRSTAKTVTRALLAAGVPIAGWIGWNWEAERLLSTRPLEQRASEAPTCSTEK